MRESRSSGSVEGVMGDHDSYSDFPDIARHAKFADTLSQPPSKRKGSYGTGCASGGLRLLASARG